MEETDDFRESEQETSTIGGNRTSSVFVTNFGKFVVIFCVIVCVMSRSESLKNRKTIDFKDWADKTAKQQLTIAQRAGLSAKDQQALLNASPHYVETVKRPRFAGAFSFRRHDPSDPPSGHRGLSLPLAHTPGQHAHPPMSVARKPC